MLRGCASYSIIQFKSPTLSVSLPLRPSLSQPRLDSVIFMNLKDIGASAVSCYSGNKNHFFSWILFCLLPKFLGTPIAYVPFFLIKVVDRSPSSAFVLDNSGET